MRPRQGNSPPPKHRPQRCAHGPRETASTSAFLLNVRQAKRPDEMWSARRSAAGNQSDRDKRRAPDGSSIEVPSDRATARFARLSRSDSESPLIEGIREKDGRRNAGDAARRLQSRTHGSSAPHGWRPAVRQTPFPRDRSDAGFPRSGHPARRSATAPADGSPQRTNPAGRGRA